MIRRESERLRAAAPALDGKPRGIVALDMRLPLRVASHHQEIVVVRGEPPSAPAAFLGGLDAVFTRRDAPDARHPFDPERPRFLAGDSQTGERPWLGAGVPPADRHDGVLWPARSTGGTDYRALDRMGRPPTQRVPDLSERSAAGHDTLYGDPRSSGTTSTSSCTGPSYKRSRRRSGSDGSTMGAASGP